MKLEFLKCLGVSDAVFEMGNVTLDSKTHFSGFTEEAMLHFKA